LVLTAPRHLGPISIALFNCHPAGSYIPLPRLQCCIAVRYGTVQYGSHVVQYCTLYL
jgi:hypothetical protein